jgi:hypothetical protein
MRGSSLLKNQQDVPALNLKSKVNQKEIFIFYCYEEIWLVTLFKRKGFVGA